MILGVIRRILKEDLSRSGEVPSWLDALLEPLNQFIDQVGVALQKNLTFRDNFACKVTTQTFTHAVEATINPQSKQKVTGVIPLSGGEELIDAFGWRILSDGQIGVTVRFVDTSASADCSVILFFG